MVANIKIITSNTVNTIIDLYHGLSFLLPIIVKRIIPVIAACKINFADS